MDSDRLSDSVCVALGVPVGDGDCDGVTLGLVEVVAAADAFAVADADAVGAGDEDGEAVALADGEAV